MSSPRSAPSDTSRGSNAPVSLRTMTTARLPVRMTASEVTTRRELLAPDTRSRSNIPGVSLPCALSTSKRAFRVRVDALTSGRISFSSPSNDLGGIGLQRGFDLLAPV